MVCFVDDKDGAKYALSEWDGSVGAFGALGRLGRWGVGILNSL